MTLISKRIVAHFRISQFDKFDAETACFVYARLNDSFLFCFTLYFSSNIQTWQHLK
ncbi:hypothetical protein SAMN05444274_10641 [Mariniphaga anaerophila]|uniref:Uncharacterized protein n=1 Tax=Mariniphaga anaerophila TaxID=1484053 RepID=A0A1M5CBD2_9BACT|nr:hypothetical protein SAMN05444274_10641 [Mariniphaga anaerophila]